MLYKCNIIVIWMYCLNLFLLLKSWWCKDGASGNKISHYPRRRWVGFHININVSEILYKGNICPHFIFFPFALTVSDKLRLGKLQCIKYNSLNTTVWANLKRGKIFFSCRKARVTGRKKPQYTVIFDKRILLHFLSFLTSSVFSQS